MLSIAVLIICLYQLMKVILDDESDLSVSVYLGVAPVVLKLLH